MSNKENDKYFEELEELRIDAEDEFKTLEDAEKDLKDAEEWIVKRRLAYVEATVKYYKFKEKQNE